MARASILVRNGAIDRVLGVGADTHTVEFADGVWIHRFATGDEGIDLGLSDELVRIHAQRPLDGWDGATAAAIEKAATDGGRTLPRRGSILSNAADVGVAS